MANIPSRNRVSSKTVNTKVLFGGPVPARLRVSRRGTGFQRNIQKESRLEMEASQSNKEILKKELIWDI